MKGIQMPSQDYIDELKAQIKAAEVAMKTYKVKYDIAKRYDPMNKKIETFWAKEKYENVCSQVARLQNILNKVLGEGECV